MPSAQEILATKGSVVHTIDPTASVLEATRRMNEHKLGALVVMNEGQVAGIFTERDVLRRIVAAARNPETTTVGEVMTTDVICVSPETDLDEVSSLMQQRRIRHVPVCDDRGKLQGMLSIGDLNAFHVTHQEAHINFLSEYIYGRA